MMIKGSDMTFNKITQNSVKWSNVIILVNVLIIFEELQQNYDNHH